MRDMLESYDSYVVSDFAICSQCCNVIIGMLKTSLPAFKALRDFEWIGYSDMPVEMVQALLNTHKHLHGLGLM
jgi:hypothetical protein